MKKTVLSLMLTNEKDLMESILITAL